MSKNIQILNGPSREELFDGLRLFAESRQVPFTIEDAQGQIVVQTIITSIGAIISLEGESGQLWNIELMIPTDDIPSHFVSVQQKQKFAGLYVVFKAQYTTKKRNGVLAFE